MQNAGSEEGVFSHVVAYPSSGASAYTYNEILTSLGTRKCEVLTLW